MATPVDDRSEEFRAIADMAEAFAHLVEHLTARHSVELTPDAIVEFGQQVMPRAQQAGLVVRAKEGLRTVAGTTTGLFEDLDRLRSLVGEGLATDTLEVNDLVVCGDLSTDPRYEHFGPLVVKELGIRSMAAYRLRIAPSVSAALLFVSDWPWAFDEVSESIGAIVAAYCSLVLTAEHLLNTSVAQSQARQVHREIGTAVGILLAQEGITAAEGYRRLHEASTRLARTLPDLARHVLRHRELPDQ